MTEDTFLSYWDTRTADEKKSLLRRMGTEDSALRNYFRETARRIEESATHELPSVPLRHDVLYNPEARLKRPD